MPGFPFGFNARIGRLNYFLSSVGLAISVAMVIAPSRFQRQRRGLVTDIRRTSHTRGSIAPPGPRFGTNRTHHQWGFWSPQRFEAFQSACLVCLLSLPFCGFFTGPNP